MATLNARAAAVCEFVSMDACEMSKHVKCLMIAYLFCAGRECWISAEKHTFSTYLALARNKFCFISAPSVYLSMRIHGWSNNRIISLHVRNLLLARYPQPYAMAQHFFFFVTFCVGARLRASWNRKIRAFRLFWTRNKWYLSHIRLDIRVNSCRAFVQMRFVVVVPWHRRHRNDIDVSTATTNVDTMTNGIGYVINVIINEHTTQNTPLPIPIPIFTIISYWGFARRLFFSFSIFGRVLCFFKTSTSNIWLSVRRLKLIDRPLWAYTHTHACLHRVWPY